MKMPILKCSVLTSDTARRGEPFVKRHSRYHPRFLWPAPSTANNQQNIAMEKTKRESKHYFFKHNHHHRMMMIINKGKGWHWSCCIIQQSFPYPLCQNNHHHHHRYHHRHYHHDRHLKVISYSFYY